MNYKHSYHAGNFGDVLKHALLIPLIERLKAKPKPFAVLDIFAGAGMYDLGGAEAQRTLEFERGVAPVFAAKPPALADYLDLIARENVPGELRFYPGSPRFAKALLRPEDRLVLTELHPEEHRRLRGEFRDESGVGIHLMDAYQALKAHLPPKERRGLILIDPPFEVTDEFDRIVQGLSLALKRFANGIYVIWYPIRDRPPVRRFHGLLEPIEGVLAVELCLTPDDDPKRLNGAGMVIVNPPWQFEVEAAERVRVLAELYRAEFGRTFWISPPR